MLLVVGVHVLGIYNQTHSRSLPFSVFRNILIICDFMFFVLSGYFAYREANTLKDFLSNCVRIMNNIIIPVLVFAALLDLFSYKQFKINYSFIEVFKMRLLGGNWWFVSAIIPYLFLAPVFFLVIKYMNNKLLVFIGTFIILANIIFVALRDNFSNRYVDILRGFMPINSEMSCYFLAFCFGMAFNKIKVSKFFQSKSFSTLAIVCLVIPIVCSIFHINIFSAGDDGIMKLFIIPSIFLLQLFMRIDIKNLTLTKIISNMSKACFGVYLCHFKLLFVPRKVFSYFHVSGASFPVFWILCTLTVFFVAITFSLLVNKLIIFPVQSLVRNKILK